MSIEENLLIVNAKLGDKEAFNQLVKNSYGKLVRFIDSRFSTYLEKEDIVQESIVKAYKNINTFKGLSSFSTWLCTIAKQLVWRKRRGYRPSLCQLNANLAWTGKNPAEVIEFNELQNLSNRFIFSLKRREREVFYLRIMEGMSIKDISQQTGASNDAIKKAFQRANKKWKKYFLPKVMDDYG